MSKIPEVFAIFEQKLAHVLSFTVVPLKSKDLKNALEEILTYFSSIVERASKAESRIAELEAERRWRIIADGEFPEDRATVLVAFTEYPEQIDILTATYYKHYEGFGGVDNWWDIEGWYSGNVTHWMPLPQPPEERKR